VTLKKSCAMASGLAIAGLGAGFCVIAMIFGQVTAPSNDASRDPRLFHGCTNDMGLHEIADMYHLTLPQNISNLHFCGQEDWSGASAELSLETNESGLASLLSKSSNKQVELTPIKASGLAGDWISIPKGTPLKYASFTNKIDKCLNTIDIKAVDIGNGKLKIYIMMDCSS
jgi:hypothetical protein